MCKEIGQKIPIKLKRDKKNIFLFREEDGKLIIQGTHVIYILENTAKDIYYAINNKKTINEIIKKLTSQYNLPKDKISRGVILFIKKLSEKKIIELKSP